MQTTEANEVYVDNAVEPSMSKQQIMQWINECKDFSYIRERIAKYGLPANPSQNCLEARSSSVDALAALYLARGDANLFYSHYGNQFKWQRRLCMTELNPLIKGATQLQCPTNPQTDICWIRSGNIKYVLQLRNTMTNDEWIDWLSIRKSDSQNGGLGLFAERQFPEKSCVGVWCGELVWRHNVAGVYVTDDMLENSLNVKITEDDLLFFDNNCLYTLMKPSLDWVNNEGIRLFMGLHFMSRTRSNNSFFENDGLCFTMNEIEKDQELYFGYDNSMEEKQQSSLKDTNTEDHTNNEIMSVLPSKHKGIHKDTESDEDSTDEIMLVSPSKNKGVLEDTDSDEDTNDKKQCPAKRVCMTARSTRIEHT